MLQAETLTIIVYTCIIAPKVLITRVFYLKRGENGWFFNDRQFDYGAEEPRIRRAARDFISTQAKWILFETHFHF